MVESSLKQDILVCAAMVGSTTVCSTSVSRRKGWLLDVWNDADPFEQPIEAPLPLSSIKTSGLKMDARQQAGNGRQSASVGVGFGRMGTTRIPSARKSLLCAIHIYLCMRNPEGHSKEGHSSKKEPLGAERA
ncbi:hypothetical protein C8F01DRAFT_1233404 [Mycena amicta]|nr:hypothetical protein C8F01DRAFT_1233404 [Mycena amicta]